MLIGANGSGKTALLEAIGVLGAAADGRVDDVELLRRGVRPGVPKLYKNAFADLPRLPRVIKLRAESTFGNYYSVSLDNPKDSPATPWRFSTETLGRAPRKPRLEARVEGMSGSRSLVAGSCPRSIRSSACHASRRPHRPPTRCSKRCGRS